MKLKVVKGFRDKFDHSVRYQPGTVIDIEDEARAKDIVARGLGKAVNEPKTEKNSKS